MNLTQDDTWNIIAIGVKPIGYVNEQPCIFLTFHPNVGTEYEIAHNSMERVARDFTQGFFGSEFRKYSVKNGKWIHGIY